MSDRSNYLSYGLEYWATQSMQEGSDERTRITGHIQRTQVRFWMFVAALMIAVISSVILEYARILAGGTTISLWRWLGGMVPGLLGLIAVLSVSTAFAQEVYDVQDWHSALGYVWLLWLGRAPFSLFDLKPSEAPLAPYPIITAQHGRISEKHEDTLLARFGGPGYVTIFNDSAVFLERFGRFTRVAGPGKIFLRRFERIHEVMDLRPQERSFTTKAVTKDGIPVQTEVQVRFQLARLPDKFVAPSSAVPYLVYQWALFRAGRCHLRVVNVDSGEESISHWSNRASGIGGSMRALIAEYRLDELLQPHEPEQEPLREISQRLYDRLVGSASNFGAEILEVRMGALEPTQEEITKERIANWQTVWRSRAQKEEARGIAEAIRERGTARAYAQMEIILALTREFQDLAERDMALSAEFVALRFIEALRQAWTRPGSMVIPSEIVRTLDYLQRIVRQEYALPRSDTAHERP